MADELKAIDSLRNLIWGINQNEQVSRERVREVCIAAERVLSGRPSAPDTLLRSDVVGYHEEQESGDESDAVQSRSEGCHNVANVQAHCARIHRESAEHFRTLASSALPASTAMGEDVEREAFEAYFKWRKTLPVGQGYAYESFQGGYQAARSATPVVRADAVGEEVSGVVLPKWLMGSAQALLNMDRRGVLIPHGIGGHARAIIQAFLDAHKSFTPAEPQTHGKTGFSTPKFRSPFEDFRPQPKGESDGK